MNKLTEKIINKLNYIPDIISINTLQNIAVKYFYIYNINKSGDYIGKLCGGFNGVAQTEPKRKPFVKAFCFNAIANHYQGKTYNMYNEFVKGIKELYTINLGVDKEERLLRAQGAMYMFMKNNNKLKELLLFEFENKKEYLPFILKID